MITEEFNKYISEVVMDFTSHTHGIRKIVRAENDRQKQIRLEIILLVRLYKGLELSEKEKEILSRHPFQYDYKTDLNRCIYQIAYEITDKTSGKINVIKMGGAYKFDGKTYGIYREYLAVLKKYTNSLLHAMCANHQLVLVDLDKHEGIRPVMGFDSECFVNDKEICKKRLSLRKK